MAIMADFRTLLKTSSPDEGLYAGGIRLFHALEFAPYRISIQASAVHYCTPKALLDDLYAYETWEVGLMDTMGVGLDVGVFNFPWVEEHFFFPSQHLTHSKPEGGGAAARKLRPAMDPDDMITVGGFIPTDDVQQIVEDLERISGEPIPVRSKIRPLPSQRQPALSAQRQPLATRHHRRVVFRK
jgi:hypothetical protein